MVVQLLSIIHVIPRVVAIIEEVDIGKEVATEVATVTKGDIPQGGGQDQDPGLIRDQGGGLEVFRDPHGTVQGLYLGLLSDPQGHH